MTPFFPAVEQPVPLVTFPGKRRRGGVVFLAAATAVMGAAAAASACSVPVFRYALEHWEPDPYRLMVFHRGPLSVAEEEQLASLAQRLHDPDGRRRANLDVVTVDLAGEVEAEVRALGERHGGDSFPVVVLQRPTIGPSSGEVVCRGPLQEAFLERVFDSPLRKTIAAQLLEGESIVWVLLESGDAARDEAAFSTLTADLQRLAETLRLPTIDPADAAELTVAPETLKISFAAHRLSRADEAEQVFREMLLTVEPDLRDDVYRGEPMAFPIFGRGRVLYALIGEGINRETIEEACRFLTAGCQCTVKRENPGIDVLFAVAWSRYVAPTVPLKSPPPLVGLAGFGAEENSSAAAEAGRSPEVAGNLAASATVRPEPRAAPSDDERAAAAGAVIERVTLPSSDSSTGASVMSPALYAVLSVVLVVLVGTVVGLVLLRRG